MTAAAAGFADAATAIAVVITAAVAALTTAVRRTECAGCALGRLISCMEILPWLGRLIPTAGRRTVLLGQASAARRRYRSVADRVIRTCACSTVSALPVCTFTWWTKESSSALRTFAFLTPAASRSVRFSANVTAGLVLK